MNKKNLFLSSILSLGLLTVGCTGGNTSTEGTDSGISNFEIRQMVKSIERNYLCEGEDAVFADSLKIYSEVKIVVEWPEKLGDADIKVLQDSLLSSIFSKPETTIDKSMIKSAETPEGSDMFTMKPIDTIPNEPCMIYTRDVLASAVSSNSDFISYQITTYSYTGGAHGMTESHYVNYDLDSATVITAANAFRPNTESYVLQAIKDNLMTQYDATSMEELEQKGIFTDQIFTSPNFYLEGSEIVFHYNPYDIAPYSEGSIEARVPYYQIKNCLSPMTLHIFNDTDSE